MKTRKSQSIVFGVVIFVLSLALQACVPEPTVTPQTPEPTTTIPTAIKQAAPLAVPDVNKALLGSNVFYSPLDYTNSIALSAPEDFALPQPTLKEFYQIAFLIDLSQSMYATCTESEANLRSQVPRFLISLLQAYYQGVQLNENQIQIGIYGFRSQLELSQSIAFKPLDQYNTIDYDNLTKWYQYKQTDQGNNYGNALDNLQKQFSAYQTPAAKKIIIIISDGWLIKRGEMETTQNAIESLLSDYAVVMLKPDCQTLNPNLQTDAKVSPTQAPQDLVTMYTTYSSTYAKEHYDNWAKILKDGNAFIAHPYTCTSGDCRTHPLQLLKNLILHPYFQGLFPQNLEWMEDSQNEVLIESSDSTLTYIKMKIVSSSQEIPTYSIRPGSDNANQQLLSQKGYIYDGSLERVGACWQKQSYFLVRNAKNQAGLSAYWIEEKRFLENAFRNESNAIESGIMLVDTNDTQTQSLTILNQEYPREFFHIFIPTISALNKLISSTLQDIKQCYAIVVTVLDKDGKPITPSLPWMFDIDSQNLKFRWQPEQFGYADYQFNVRLVQKVNNEPQGFLIEKNLGLAYRYNLQPDLDSIKINCSDSCQFSLDIAFMEKRFFDPKQDVNPEIRLLVPFESSEEIQDGESNCYKPRTQNTYSFEWRKQKSITAYAFDPLKQNEFSYNGTTLSFTLPENYSCGFNKITFVHLKWANFDKEIICYVAKDNATGWACKETKVTQK